MPKTPLRFSTGAPTPLYLPLYVFKRHQGFHLQADYSVAVSPPDNDEEDGDGWAVRQLVKGSADFALCDPIVAEQQRGVHVVATLIRRMAFWAVARQDIRRFKEFSNFNHIISYPEGMTGNLVARMIQKQVGNRQRVIPVAVNSEFDQLLELKAPSVALTTNLLLANKFTEDNPDFKISNLWELDPAFSSFMLTGLLVRTKDLRLRNTFIRNVVQGIYRAVALAMSDTEEGVRTLQEEYKTLAPAEARDFVTTVKDNLLYPISLRPELSSWDNVRKVHITGVGTTGVRTRVKPNTSSTETFLDSVNTEIPVDVDWQNLSLLVRFGKGDMYEELSRMIESENRISLQSSAVVGWYSRFEDTQRKELKDWVEKIKSGVLNPSKEDENYLIWGTSGSGKSYLIEELGRTLEESGLCRFEKLDFAKFSRKKNEDKAASIESETRPVLCLLDEIDTTSALTMDYSFLFSKLRWRSDSGKQIVFVLAGSTTGSVDELADEIMARKKGEDMLSFVPKDQRFPIPDYTKWDRLIIFISQAMLALQKKSSRLEGVEKLALYYIAASYPTEKARGLARLAKKAVGRMARGANKLQYKDLFDSTLGSHDQYSFYSEHFSNAQKLRGQFIEILD